MSGSGECRLKGLCIKASPLGENDRLITILTDEQGIVSCLLYTSDAADE